MPINGYTVGRDVTVNLQSPEGGLTGGIVINPNQVTSFDARTMKREDWARPLNVPPMPIYMPDGWRGTLTVDRMDDTLDVYQDTIESDFWNGNNISAGTIRETITEVNGTITVKTYTNCMFWVDDLGSFRADGIVRQRVEFSAGQCTVTNGAA